MEMMRRTRVERPRRDPREHLEPSVRGLLLSAWSGREPTGFACLYWAFSSVQATDVVLLNDPRILAVIATAAW
jgi:hypothetical protein